MTTKQTFWDTTQTDPLSLVYGRSWSKMYREGEAIIYQKHNFDEEDGQGYLYTGKFNVADYTKALQELKEKGISRITGVSNDKEFTLRMKSTGENIELFYSGVPEPNMTPSGTQLSGSLFSNHKLEELLLKEVKNEKWEKS